MKSREALKDHYARIFPSTLEILPSLENSAEDKVLDHNGGCTASLMGILRVLGVAAFYCFGDIAGFKAYLTRAAGLQLDLCRRANSGDPIDPSLVTLLCYKGVFNALASGSFPIAAEICQSMVQDDKASRKFDHPFDRAMGISVRSVVLGEDGDLEDLKGKVSKLGNKNFEGYYLVLKAIADRSQALAQEALAVMAQGHVRLSNRGAFMNAEDKCLNVWGIALVNLAAAKGIEVEADSEYVPKQLLVGVAEAQACL